MKAVAVFPKTKEVKVIDHPEPKIQQPTEVKLKMLQVGICGTDREIWRFQYGTPPAGSDYLITGHESFGQVIEIGPEVKTVKVGDYIVPTVRRGCPENCVSCANLQADFCFTGHFTERGINGVHGYMTEFVVEDEKYLTLIPPQLADVGVLLEPLTITEKGLIETLIIQNRLPWEGRNALVLGAGPVGLLAAMAFLNRGLKTTVVDHHKKPNAKADFVMSIGATFMATEEMNAQQIADAIGPIDIVLEATGVAKVAFDFLDVLGTNGIFIFTGIPDPIKDSALDIGTLMRRLVLKNQVVLGTVNASKAAFQNGMKDLQDFFRKWPNQLKGLITDRVPIDQFQNVLNNKRTGQIKVVLTL